MAFRILNILRLILSDLFYKMVRFLSWNFRLLSVQTGKGVHLSYPLRIEGKGKLLIGDKTSIKGGVKFGIVDGGKILLGNNVKIHERVNVHAGLNTTIQLEENTSILSHSTLRNGNAITLQKGSSISSYCNIFPREEGYDGKFMMGKESNIGDNTLIDTCDDVIIKDFVAVGPGCVFYTHDHDYKSGLIAAWKGKVKTGKIIIENGAWVGARVTILPHVIIGEKAVVAAGSVVTKSVLPGDIVGGIPAKSLKKNIHE